MQRSLDQSCPAVKNGIQFSSCNRCKSKAKNDGDDDDRNETDFENTQLAMPSKKVKVKSEEPAIKNEQDEYYNQETDDEGGLEHGVKREEHAIKNEQDEYYNQETDDEAGLNNECAKKHLKALAPPSSSAAAASPSMAHCMRCHETFSPNDNDSSDRACVVEHDHDTFEGSRNGTPYYTGTLGCCGAYHRFHRFYDHGDDATEPKYCYEGPHTSNPDEVEYNGKTIKICNAGDCAEDLCAASKNARDKQAEAKTKANAAKRKAREEEKTAKRARINKLKNEGKTREARRLRAEMLGMDPEDSELNSDNDPDGCEEFDYASDSSLVPPWLME